MSELQSVQQVLAILDPSPVATWLTTVTPLQWTSVLIGPLLALGAPLIQRVWPSFAGGKPLFRAPLRTPVSLSSFWSFRFWTTVFPTAIGCLTLSHPASAFLVLGGLSHLVAVLVSQHRVRNTAELLDHAFRLNGTLYRYDSLRGIQLVDGRHVLVTAETGILVTSQQLEQLRPSLWRTGVGDGVDRRVRLRGDLDLK